MPENIPQNQHIGASMGEAVGHAPDGGGAGEVVEDASYAAHGATFYAAHGATFTTSFST